MQRESLCLWLRPVSADERQEEPPLLRRPLFPPLVGPASQPDGTGGPAGAPPDRDCAHSDGDSRPDARAACGVPNGPHTHRIGPSVRLRVAGEHLDPVPVVWRHEGRVRLYLRVEAALPRHPKVRKLAVMYGVEPYLIVGFLVSWWGYCGEFGSGGNPAETPGSTLDELAAPILRSAKVAVVPAIRDALRAVRLLDADDRPHDWQDFSGKQLAAREADVQRKRKLQGISKEVPPPVVQHSTAHKDTASPRAGDEAFLRSVADNYAGLDVLLLHFPAEGFSDLARAIRSAEAPRNVVADVRDVGPGGMLWAETGRPTWDRVALGLRDTMSTKNGWAPIKFRAFVKRVASDDPGKPMSRQDRAFQVVDEALGEAS